MVDIVNKAFLFLNDKTGEYRAYQEGDDIKSCYYHITLSNDFDFYICGWWDVVEAEAEIDRAVKAAQKREDVSAAMATAAMDMVEGL